MFVACALVLGTPTLWAAENTALAGTVPANGGSATESNALAPASEAEVVLVGASAEWPELEALLRELLGRDAITCHFSRAARFSADDLFDREHERSARVFIRLGDKQLVRLYFRAASGERFLLRTLTLENGLDDVGRERIGQVVEASLVALLRSPVGLDKAQASVEMARQAPAEATPQPAPSERASATPAPAVNDRIATEPGRARALELGVNLRYAAQFSGPELYPAHGPGVELTFGLRSARLLLRARLVAEHFLPQKLRIQELETKLETNALRLSLDLGIPFTTQQTFVFALAAGVDSVSLEPGTPRVVDVTPAGSRTSVAPFLRPELRYEIAKGSLLFGFAAFSDVSLRNTHYDLIESGGRRVLATPWIIRPGATLALGLRW